MSTASFELAQAIPHRVRELQILAAKAKNVEESDEELYNAICRGTCVLLASHLEGFLKELSSSLIADLNYHLGEFSKMPAAMQRAFCQKIAYYEGVSSGEIDARIQQLLSFFAKNSVLIDMRAFSYRENPNKNPSANVIEATLDRLGVPQILSAIAIPAYEVVFDNNERTNYRLHRDLRRHVSNLFHFPFREAPEPYKPVWRQRGKADKGATLWHTFVEDVMVRRHGIAHGDTMANETSWEELQRDAEKVGVLMHGILFSAASFLSEKS